MDASQRWETEALRSGSLSHKTPPRPSTQEQAPEPAPHDPDADWVTLKDAEAATGIPLNTLRKWSRKAAIPSYLTTDGDLTLRMVDIDAVVQHAHDLGRTVTPRQSEEPTHVDTHEVQVEVDTPEAKELVEPAGAVPLSGEKPSEDAASEVKDEPEDSVGYEPPIPPEGTLIVPLDAWNKMLNQLGKLHEACQQLAEARERAAKAETEAKFLRERLAELRTKNDQDDIPPFKGDGGGAPAAMQGDNEEPKADGRGAPAATQGDTAEPKADDTDALVEDDDAPTTSYWRYLTFGWRDRKRRTSNK
jgi:hypothetical protein